MHDIHLSGDISVYPAKGEQSLMSGLLEEAVCIPNAPCKKCLPSGRNLDVIRSDIVGVREPMVLNHYDHA